MFNLRSMMKRGNLWICFVVAAMLTCLAAGDGERQIGDFEEQADIGKVEPAGKGEFDKKSDQYRISSGGENIWGKHDDFHFVYRKVSGDVTISAKITFIDEGKNAHRKAGCMIRQGLEADDPYVDVMVHGDGLIALQSRSAKGEVTTNVKSVVKAPAVVRLERKGDEFSLYVAPIGEKGNVGEQQLVGPIKLGLKDPVYVGLAVSAHDPKVTETAVFSGVKMEGEERK